MYISYFWALNLTALPIQRKEVGLAIRSTRGNCIHCIKALSFIQSLDATWHPLNPSPIQKKIKTPPWIFLFSNYRQPLEGENWMHLPSHFSPFWNPLLVLISHCSFSLGFFNSSILPSSPSLIPLDVDPLNLKRNHI